MALRSLNITVSDVRHRELYQKSLLQLNPIMDRIQCDENFGNAKQQEQFREKMMNQVEKIYKEAGLKVFSETLFRMMIVPFQAKDSPYVNRVIDFFFAIVSDNRWEESSSSPNDTMISVNSNTSMLEDGSSEPLPMRILRLCERYNGESRILVRQRVLQTVGKIIPNCIAPADIRRNLQAKLIKMLLIRIKDKSDSVRAYAASILCSFLHASFPFQPQIMETLQIHMAHDPDAAVRAKIVCNIKVTDQTYEFIAERAGDPNPNVRAAALTKITDEIKLSTLSLEMREAILQANTSEDTPKNVQNALTRLLEHWLKGVQDDPCDFLRILNVRKRPKLCRTALDNLYNQPAEDAFEKIRAPLLGSKQYPEDSLGLESTYLWKYLFERFRDNPYVYKKLALPVSDMIEYIKEYLDVIEEEGDLPQADLDFRGWMLGDMLRILTFLPTEEGERRSVLEFLPSLFQKKRLLDSRNCGWTMNLIKVCSADIENENTVIDIVNGILDSDRPSKGLCNATNKSAHPRLDPFNKDYRVELGTLTHKLKKLEADQNAAIKEKDMYKAQTCQDQIEEILEKIKKIKESVEDVSESQNLNESMMSDSPDMEDQWTFTDRTMLVAMSIVRGNILLVNKISSFSRTFYELYVVNAVRKCQDPVVRALALEIMCIFAIDYESEAAKAAMYCLTALLKDVMIVKESALKCLYDLALRYSFAKLGASPEVQKTLMGIDSSSRRSDNSKNTNDENEDSASTLKGLLFSYIRHENVKLVKVSVAGVLKLLFKHEMNPTRIITTFLINWAIPSHETQVRFKDVALMIPIYANLGESEAEEVAKCLMICIHKVRVRINSSTNPSPDQVPHPDIDKIINLVVKCTDPNRLSKFQRPYIAHEIIANAALEDLRNSDHTTEGRILYAKLLKILDLRQCPKESITRMIHDLNDIAEQSNRTVNQTLVGFHKYLESIVDGDGGEENEAAGAGAGAFDDDDETMHE